ncbi:nucleotidyltransferase family protein [Pseudorhodobacter ferrugineus]|uniref:nucleotidyltransferase family protein n=1 Tax=Pseudorhodobacter ferrugineus TaxID=77008 RepID=UPI0003B645DC|nr:nucleotidyltransferase family protein [Pseudorhodobacter ferrugineus]
MHDKGKATAVTVLILAAGASSRMRGADKLLEPVAGQPLLRRVAQIALATGLPVMVTLSDDRPAREAALDGLGLQRLRVGDASQGMAASLRAGVAAIPVGSAILILLADMPEIDAQDLAAMIASYRQAPDMVHRGATADGTPGHPVLFPAWLRAHLIGLHGDVGARSVLREVANLTVPVTLPERHALTDLDTPEDWARWRAVQT